MVGPNRGQAQVAFVSDPQPRNERIQARAAWRERQRLDDRLSEVFADVVDHVITFADGCLHALPHGDSATWSPDACRWTATS
jgi:hypothetical protein